MPNPRKSLFFLLSQLSLVCMLLALGIVIWCKLSGYNDRFHHPDDPDQIFMELSSLSYPLSILFGLIASFSAIFGGIYDQFIRKEARGTDRRGILNLLGVIAVAWIIMILASDMFAAAPRSVTARAKGDMRVLTIALENYYLDHNAYPAWTANPARNVFNGLKDQKGLLKNQPTFTRQNGTSLATLTTPVAYVSSYSLDPFIGVEGATFCYWTPDPDSHPAAATTSTACGTGYILWSTGPDRRYDLTLDNIAQAYTPAFQVPNTILHERTYDPSNGSFSAGDVYRYKQ